jgi:hypothetical protein
MPRRRKLTGDQKVHVIASRFTTGVYNAIIYEAERLKVSLAEFVEQATIEKLKPLVESEKNAVDDELIDLEVS